MANMVVGQRSNIWQPTANPHSIYQIEDSDIPNIDLLIISFAFLL
jgi:hypothetical protein